MRQAGAAYFGSDLSESMLEETKAELKRSDYYCNALNKSVFDLTNSPIYNIEDVIPKEYSKFAHFSIQNNESLTYQDESFDCYVANLSLMLVDNHSNQLSECARVL